MAQHKALCLSYEEELAALKGVCQTAKKDLTALYERYHKKLQYDAPVDLWEERADKHWTRSGTAFQNFSGLTVLAIIGVLFTVVVLGDTIAASFIIEGRDGISPKGPLTIAALVTVTSLILWVIRLQYRVYLSERHLALDASEKKAFAQTYLAMLGDENVTKESEAIVLAALFRPTQDGIIKDEAGGIDPTVANLIAKNLSK